VAIIALLIAILLPSLAKARDQAQRVVCASNLHQTAIALLMYGDGNRGQLIPLPYDGSHPTIYKNLTIGYDLVKPYKPYVGDFTIWMCPAVDAPPIDDPSNDNTPGRGPTAPQYSSYPYFIGCADYPDFGDSTRTIGPAIVDILPRGPIMQDQMIQRLNGDPYENGYWSNHNKQGFRYAHANPPSACYISIDQTPAEQAVVGGNIVFGDGSAGWFNYGDLQDVGWEANNGNAATAYSRPIW
jgi:type II secretory pathway pseudopilin PulG